MNVQRFNVSLLFSASKSMTIDAESAEVALEIAYKRCHVSLCHQCAHAIELGEAIGAEVRDENGKLLIRDMP